MNSLSMDIPPYHYQTIGSSNGESVFFLHGFLGTGQDWLPIVHPISQRYQVVLIDLPGHGCTPIEPYQTWKDAAEGIVAIAQKLDIDSFHIVGYSMGSRFALNLLDHYPERVISACLISTFPGYQREYPKIMRRKIDLQLRNDLLWFGLDVFWDAWYEQPMFRSLHWHPGLLEKLKKQRCHHSVEDLAESIYRFSPGWMPSFWSTLENSPVPILCITGEIDDKYTSILHQILAVGSHIHGTVIPGCNHAVHLERPDLIIEECLAWLEQNDIDWVEESLLSINQFSFSSS